MAKITIKVDDRTLDWLALRAERDKVSVEQVVAEKLQTLRPRQWQRPSAEAQPTKTANIPESSMAGVKRW